LNSYQDFLNDIKLYTKDDLIDSVIENITTGRYTPIKDGLPAIILSYSKRLSKYDLFYIAKKACMKSRKTYIIKEDLNPNETDLNFDYAILFISAEQLKDINIQMLPKSIIICLEANITPTSGNYDDVLYALKNCVEAVEATTFLENNFHNFVSTFSC
jgi:hypothetical protein